MKILVTGGCSFSECISPWIETWPKHLAKITHLPHTSTAMGSQGNGLISRRIIYEVTQLLQTHDPNDILVGIMWSHPSRHDVYLSVAPVMVEEDGYIENPTKFVSTSPGAWTILNHGWQSDLAKQYYGSFHDNIGQYIYTYEHILRTQWFLKLHKVKYFMTTYTKEVCMVDSHPDVKHLYDQIDFGHFLPVNGEYEWCRDYSRLPFLREGDKHPSSEQHQQFTEKVIIPFLISKDYI